MRQLLNPGTRPQPARCPKPDSTPHRVLSMQVPFEVLADYTDSFVRGLPSRDACHAEEIIMVMVMVLMLSMTMMTMTMATMMMFLRVMTFLLFLAVAPRARAERTNQTFCQHAIQDGGCGFPDSGVVPSTVGTAVPPLQNLTCGLEFLLIHLGLPCGCDETIFCGKRHCCRDPMSFSALPIRLFHRCGTGHPGPSRHGLLEAEGHYGMRRSTMHRKDRRNKSNKTLQPSEAYCLPSDRVMVLQRAL